MPLTKGGSKFNIPVAVHKVKENKKSQKENAIVIKKEKTKTKRNENKFTQAPVQDETTKRRHLSVVGNNKEGSKSSVSDTEEVFYTANKDITYVIHEESKGRKVEDNPNVSRIFHGGVSQESKKWQEWESLDEKTEVSTIYDSNRLESETVEVADDIQTNLPEDVVNIEVESGLYEYSREVVVYLMQLEVTSIVPPDFLDEGLVSCNMRSILVDWLIQVQHHLKLCQETLYLAVGILDQVLHRREVDPDKLQLVGITSLLIASKLEEYYPVDIKKLLHLTENSYKKVEVTQMERVLLDVLEFQVYLPSPQVFILRFTRASFRLEDPEFIKTCQYLFDSHLPQPSHPCSAPSLLAAAALFSSSLLYYFAVNPTSTSLQPGSVWTPTLVFYTSYNWESVAPSSLEMVCSVLDSTLEMSKFTGALVKYKSHSQHQRLALSRHLQKNVLEQVKEVLEKWIESYQEG